MKLGVKILILVTVWPLATLAQAGPNESPQLSYEDAYLQCFDGNVEIGIYTDGHLAYADEELDFTDFAGKRHVIRVRRGDNAPIVFERNVVGVTDGAGNDTFQVFLHPTFGLGLEEVLSLHYDHELGYLTGYYSVPKVSEYEEVSYSRIPLQGDSMNCYDYTYGEEASTGRLKKH